MNQNDNSMDELEKAKQEVLEKLKQLEDLEKSIKEKQAIVDSQETQPQISETTTTTTITSNQPTEEPKEITPLENKSEQNIDAEEIESSKLSKSEQQSITDKKTIKAKEKEKEKLDRLSRNKAREEEQLKNFAVSVSNRKKGKLPAEPGNKGVRHTYAEVYIFVVDDNELQLKVLQEQFKNTRSFKHTKGFTNGADLLDYIKTRKFPKMSILLVVMDYFLEDSDDEEAQNGIAVLNDLKAYDPNIEVIMLSSHSDVDIATSASYFGAVTFIQKGKDAFKKILNNIVWAIHEQEKIRKKADTKKAIKIGIIGFVSIIVLMLLIDLVTHSLGIIPIPTDPTVVAPK